MKKKNYLLLATAALALVACTADDDLSAGKSTTAQGDGAIVFNMGTSAMTRATIEDDKAAGKLGNKFFVWGEKNEGQSGNDITKDVAEANTVFQNYTVKYGANTANTTTSNTQDWEYVGLPSDTIVSSASNLTPQTPTTQTIKYWDKNAADYTFTAVSADATAIKNGKVVITKKTKVSNGETVYDKGYDITVKSLAAAASVYVADRVNIAKSETTTTNEQDKIGGYVKFTFRNFQSKIRFGIFENVPGYKVVITKIVGKKSDGSNGTTDAEYTSAAKGFGVTSKFVEAGASTKYTVTYEPKVGGNETQLVTENTVKFTVDANSTKVDYLNTGGTNWLDTKFTSKSANDNKFIGETAAEATYDKTNGSDTKAYTAILPNPANAEDMTLQISYNLISEDTGEIIEVNNKSVKVPHEYCQWKPNFAYTYLFKITEQSADLYPITFDACVVEDETGKQETITTVTDPSWTVFATDADAKAYKTITKEFAAGDVIYATLSNAGVPATLSTSNTKLYTVKTNDATNYPITEGSVANAIASTASSKQITATEVTTLDGTKNFVTAVPTEDGDKITLTNSGAALTWTAAANTVYAIEYTYSVTVNNSTVEKKLYKVIRIDDAKTTSGN